MKPSYGATLLVGNEKMGYVGTEKEEERMEEGYTTRYSKNNSCWKASA
jgi:hypothetical protein